MLNLNWVEFKDLLAKSSLNFGFESRVDRYALKTFNGMQEYNCHVHYDTPEAIDFVDNYKAKGNKPMTLKRSAFSEATNEHARLTGCFDFTIAAGATISVDYTLTEFRYLDGMKYKVENNAFADSVSFQVVHPVAGVLDEFGTDWPVCPAETIKLYKAKVPAGLIIRITYKNTGAGLVRFIGGLFLHEEVV